MQLWASCACATAFIDDIEELRDLAIKKLIKSPTENLAAVVRAYNKILGLFNESRDVNS
jgi:hypothetical protein